MTEKINRKLPNPLDKFASYSIHHILLACRTTEEAKAFIDEKNQSETLAAIEQTKRLGDAVPYGDGDSAFLVIDTRRFSQFSVEKLEYEVFINGIEKAGSHGNLATTVHMTVSDVVGISFINFISWLMDEKMKTNFDGMIFMNRVVFVGHNPDGSTETVQSVTIPMHLFKMELNLDALRGTYEIEFMPNMNFDVREHGRWLTIHDASNYFSGKGDNTLGGVIKSFEDALNEKSSAYFKSVQEAFVASGRKTEDGKNYGREVKYQITLPDNWYGMKIVGPSTNDSKETNFIKKLMDDQNNKVAEEERQRRIKANTEAEEARKTLEKESGVTREPGQLLDTNVAVENERQITDVLDFIFKQTPEIAHLGVGVQTPGEKGAVTFYKHFVGITSDNNSIYVHVDVVLFRVPNLFVDGSGSNKDGKKPEETVAQGDGEFYQDIDENGRRVPKNYMEFDYIFTGKNTEVLNFDLKFQDLQWMLASQLNLGPGVTGVTENQQTGAPVNEEGKPINQRAELFMTRSYDAILMPRKSDEELKNYSSYTALLSKDERNAAVKVANDYMRNLSMYYAMAPINVIMTIRGNPDIMTKFNQNGLLNHPDSQPADTASGTNLPANVPHKTWRDDFEQRILRDNSKEFNRDGAGTFELVKTLGAASYACAPVFATVNVMGPQVAHYPGQQTNGNYAEKLLTDNYYVVFRVKNMIEGNAFTQELELYSHNIYGMGKAIIS